MRYSNPQNLRSSIDANTRIIAISYVSYLNGARVDLDVYRKLADSVGALLIVDCTQAAGYAPINASIADFAFSACYKWILGTTGTAIAFWNRVRQSDWTPATAGWHSLATGVARPDCKKGQIQVRNDALCFSRGNAGHLSIYILNEGINFLTRWLPIQIFDHVQTLTTELIDRLDTAGITVSTPRQREKHGASVCIDCKGASDIVHALSNSKILAWDGRGRVRFSFQGYNCLRDVDRIMDVFPGLWRQRNE